jgi:DNA gyrase subunit B
MAPTGSSSVTARTNGKTEEDLSRSRGAYTARDIQVLEGIQAIRHRPAMYIGSTSTSGLVHLLWEALDNAVDEAVAGYGAEIRLEVDKEGIVTVEDQGRGMPFDPMTYAGKKLPAATVLMTVPHSGGKFAEGAYKTAGGLHGVGATIINAVSEWLELDIWRDGQHFSQRFDRGKPRPHAIEPTSAKKHGTRLRWRFDRDIFDHDAYYPREWIERRLQAAAHLNRGLALHLSVWDDETDAVVTRTFHSKEGLADFVRQATPPGADPIFNKPITFQQLREEVQVEVALLPNRGYKLDLHSFANAVRTPEGGVHERGFKAALTRVANDYAAKLGLIKNREKEAFKAEVIQQGLVAALSVKLKDPQFEGQTKTKLNNAPVEGIVRSVVTEGLKEWFEARQTQARDWLKKIQDDQKLANRLAAEESLARTGQKRAETVDLDTSKFARASTTDPDRAELFIVEGQSAGGNAKQGRDASYQAILALRGKPINVINARPERLQLNKEYALLASVIGTGVRGAFNIEKCRYDKLILMSVAGDEPTLVMDDAGHTGLVAIGSFIDECMERRRSVSRYSVVSFDPRTLETRFKPLTAVIRHRNDEPMFRLTTRYNRSVKVTGSHSVFVLERGRVQLKRGSFVRPGDLLVASRGLPRPTVSPTAIDVLQTLVDAGETRDLYVRGHGVRVIAAERSLARRAQPQLWAEPRVTLAADDWGELVVRRRAQGLTLKQVASAVGVKQPITISQWERGLSRPIASHFSAYAAALGLSATVEYRLLPPIIDQLAAAPDDSANARWRKISDYKLLDGLTPDELRRIGDEVQIVPRAHASLAFPRQLAITRELVWFLGWFVAEGTLSKHQVSLNLGPKDERFLPDLRDAIRTTFGQTARIYRDTRGSGLKLYFHSVLAARLLRAWGLAERAHRKRLPDFLFSLREDLQLAFLEAYLLGDGCVQASAISFTTNSPPLKDGLLYMLGQLGLVATTSTIQPHTAQDAAIQTRHPFYQLTICGKDQLDHCRQIWQRHANAPTLSAYLARGRRYGIAGVPIGDDLIGLEVVSAEMLPPTGEFVYDFSVEGDENFVCGVGGLCTHNTDADVDGGHIRALLLALFYQETPGLIEAGKVYVAMPPLYSVKHKGRTVWLTDDDALRRFFSRTPEARNAPVKRYKGLGEMSAAELRETTMHPATRILKQVTLEDSAIAAQVVADLMDEARAEARREFLADAARRTDLDV